MRFCCAAHIFAYKIKQIGFLLLQENTLLIIRSLSKHKSKTTDKWMEVEICLEGCIPYDLHKHVPSQLWFEALNVRRLLLQRNTQPHDYLIATTIITLPIVTPVMNPITILWVWFLNFKLQIFSSLLQTTSASIKVLTTFKYHFLSSKL